MFPDFVFHLGLAAYWVLLLVLLPRHRAWLALGVLGSQLALAGTIASGAAALLGGRGMFGALGFLAWAVFVHAPGVLVAFAWRWRTEGGARFLALATTLLLLLVAAQSFWNEPTWLEVTRTRLPCTNLERPLTVVVVADLQTDRVGAYERRVLEQALAAKPDLILFPGDYIQAGRRGKQWAEPQRRVLRALLAELELSAPLGVFAVPGNVDAPGWESVFEELPAHAFVRSGRVSSEALPLAITGLDLADSQDAHLRIEAEPGRFHIVLGHQPDFALGEIDADLLVAGHCHGGQVRLPFLGPILILSRIPRDWATGPTRLDEDTWLYVSRGIGMERGWAPPLRFLCRPELTILELVPVPRN